MTEEDAALLEELKVLPHLPGGVLRLVFNQLDTVHDLCNVALVSSEWHAASKSCDDPWRRSFFAEFGEAKGVDYSSLDSWREKYIACTLDNTCFRLREKAELFDDIEDASAALERSVQDLMATLSSQDRTLNGQKWEINKKLEEVSGCPATHMQTKLGRHILDTAAATVKKGSGSALSFYPDAESAPKWAEALSPEVCHALCDGAASFAESISSINDCKEAMRSMMHALTTQQATSRRLRDSIQALRRKRTSLEAATHYRHVRRR